MPRRQSAAQHFCWHMRVQHGKASETAGWQLLEVVDSVRIEGLPARRWRARRRRRRAQRRSARRSARWTASAPRMPRAQRRSSARQPRLSTRREHHCKQCVMAVESFLFQLSATDPAHAAMCSSRLPAPAAHLFLKKTNQPCIQQHLVLFANVGQHGSNGCQPQEMPYPQWASEGLLGLLCMLIWGVHRMRRRSCWS